jgi:N-acetylneuraminic acid mutarotase
VELNIGGYRFETSVQALRRVPHTFFDAYFSGRYAQDVCADGSIFVDRDGEHFGHVLEYMRDGRVSVADAEARPSVSLLRTLKREFGFYCIELMAEQPAAPDQTETAYVMGGYVGPGFGRGILSSMERLDASSGQWIVAASMSTARHSSGACALAGEMYVLGGLDNANRHLSSVEKYSPVSDIWSAVAPMPDTRSGNAAVAVGSAIYVLGGFDGRGVASVLKFDGIQSTWSEVAPLPRARFGAAACAIGSDICVLGGFGALDGGSQASVYKLDTVTNEWSTLAPMPLVCAFHSANVLGGLIYIAGAGPMGADVLRYDPANDVWSTLTPTSTAKQGGCSFVLGEFLYAAGGLRSQSRVERYDVTSDTWTAVADTLQARGYPCAVTIGSGGPAEEQNLFDSLIAKASERRA